MGRIFYRWDEALNTFVEYDPSEKKKTVEAPALHQDEAEAFQSMVDGSWWTSKARYRKHLRDNGKIEVGNDVDGFKPKDPFATDAYNKQLREDMTRAYYEARDGMAPLTELDRARCQRINQQQKRQNHDRRERDRLGRIR